jgi:protoporphyrinogen oxidase
MSSKKSPPCENHTVDILVVGAGLAGLHSAMQLSKKHPDASIIIAEAYNYTGGRVLTYKPKVAFGMPKAKDIQWEMGAGRIHRSHHKTLSYIAKYGLTTLIV